MPRLVSLLCFTSFSLSSFFASGLFVYTDGNNCVHLRCEWRGSGKHCNPSTSLREAYRRKLCGSTFGSHEERETDADVILRIKRKYPVNTFTIVNEDVTLGKKCEKKELCCNAASVYYEEDYAAFLEYLKHPEPGQLPKFQCCVQPIPIANAFSISGNF